MTGFNEARQPVGLHDILVAWQEGWLPYRRALALTGMSAVTDLYEAAANSGVEIRMTMLPSEARAAARATRRAEGGFRAGYDSGRAHCRAPPG